MHIAAAMGVHIAAIFASMLSKRFHPGRVPHRMVKARLKRSLSYEPCKLARSLCTEKISLRRIKEAVEESQGKD